jgi:hypothetical protein
MKDVKSLNDSLKEVTDLLLGLKIYLYNYRLFRYSVTNKIL